MRFRDRREAGERLALRLRPLRGDRAVVLGLSEGGLVVAGEIAAVLGAPLDILLTEPDRGAPGRRPRHSAPSGRAACSSGTTTPSAASTSRQERAHPARPTGRGPGWPAQVAVYRHTVAPVRIAGRTVVLADDGAATGTTAHTAIRVLRARQVGRIVLAVPVAHARVLDRLAREVDQFICLRPLPWMHAVGNSYRRFSAVGDAEALELLHREPRRPVEVPR